MRPDRQNVRLSSLSCLVQMMTDKYDVAFTRLDFGQPQKVDGVIALACSARRRLTSCVHCRLP